MTLRSIFIFLTFLLIHQTASLAASQVRSDHLKSEQKAQIFSWATIESTSSSNNSTAQSCEKLAQQAAEYLRGCEREFSTGQAPEIPTRATLEELAHKITKDHFKSSSTARSLILLLLQELSKAATNHPEITRDELIKTILATHKQQIDLLAIERRSTQLGITGPLDLAATEESLQQIKLQQQLAETFILELIPELTAYVCNAHAKDEQLTVKQSKNPTPIPSDFTTNSSTSSTTCETAQSSATTSQESAELTPAPHAQYNHLSGALNWVTSWFSAQEPTAKLPTQTYNPDYTDLRAFTTAIKKETGFLSISPTIEEYFKTIRELTKLPPEIIAIIFSYEFHRFLSKFQQLVKLNPSGEFKQVECLTDGRLATTDTKSDSIKIWNPNTGELYCTITDIQPSSVFTALPGGRLAVSLRSEKSAQGVFNKIFKERAGLIQIFDPSLMKSVHSLVEPRGEITALATLPNGLLISASRGPAMRIWDPNPEKYQRTLFGDTYGFEKSSLLNLQSLSYIDKIFSIMIEIIVALPNNKIAAGCRRATGNIDIWDLTTGKILHSFSPFYITTPRFVALANGLLAAVPETSYDLDYFDGNWNTIIILDPDSGQQLRTLEHPSRIEALTALPYENMLAACSKLGFAYSWCTIKLWNTATGTGTDLWKPQERLYRDSLLQILSLPVNQIAIIRKDGFTEIWE